MLAFSFTTNEHLCLILRKSSYYITFYCSIYVTLVVILQRLVQTIELSQFSLVSQTPTFIESHISSLPL